MLFIAYIEVIAQFVLSRSFKLRFANASLALGWATYWATRPLVRFPALFVFFSHFFATQLLMYYDIATYSVFFAAQRLYYAIATYSVYDSVGSPCMYGNGAGLPAHSLFHK